MEVTFYAGIAFLLFVFVISTVFAVLGNKTATYFLWLWALLLIIALPMMNRTNAISHMVIVLALVTIFYLIFITVQYGMERVDVSHEETRRVLAEFNRRIEEERRTLARRLHDEVNPQLLLSRNVLRQIEPMVSENKRATELLANATAMLSEAYTEIRDIIKNTRIEVIDSIGFTAALESLVAHYTNIVEKPVISLSHNLPKRPPLSEGVSVSTYKIIREAILNAIKHANADRVHISVLHNKLLNSYKVEIIDDGIGVNAATRNGENSGIGMIDMCERVRVLGSTLHVQLANPENQKRPGTKLSFSFSGQLS